MIKLLCAAALSALIGANASTASGDVIEVQMVETKLVDRSGPDPSATSEIPKDAKVLTSIEARADGGSDFSAKCVVDGKTIRLKGHLGALRDGKRRVSVEFSQRDPSGAREVTTNLLLAAAEQKVIGGMTGVDGPAQLIVLTLKPDEKPANAKAE